MAKCVSNRNKFILGRVSLAITIALAVVIIITSIYLQEKGSAIWWNARAVGINGTISNAEIITHEFIQKCNPVCTGDCTDCKVNYFNAYITVSYLTYEYRYSLYDKTYHTLNYVEHALAHYKINNTVVLYYNPSNPRDVSLNFLDYKTDIVVFMGAIAFFVLFSMFMILALSPRLKDIPKEDEDIEAVMIAVVMLNNPMDKMGVNDNMKLTAEYTPVSLNNVELQPLYSRLIQ